MEVLLSYLIAAAFAALYIWLRVDDARAATRRRLLALRDERIVIAATANGYFLGDVGAPGCGDGSTAS